MSLHDFIILMTLLIGTSRYNEIHMILSIGTSGHNIKYTSEYILKLQIHQNLVHNANLKKAHMITTMRGHLLDCFMKLYATLTKTL